MTYRIRNIGIAIALAIVAALLTSFYVSNYQRNVRSGEENVQVFVAKRDIRVGTSGADVASLGLLQESEVVRRSVVPGAISSATQLDGLVAGETIHAGEQVTARRFSTPAERGIRAQITGAMRVFQLPGDANQLLVGTLRGGDRVDVVASVQVDGEGERHATRVVLRNIEVLRPAFGAGEMKVTSTSSQAVLLAVSDTQVPKLFHVVKHGDWSLQLRPPVKASDSPEAVASASSILRDGLRGRQLERFQSGGTP
jgi:pilus assembly protein CpaB